MSEMWANIPIGTIVDGDIIRLAQSSQLIVEGFDEKYVKQACYELRASDIFYDVQLLAEDKRIIVNPGDGYLLKPHCHAVSIVQERIELPKNVLGRILTKGRLFSIGILPVNTYADPGFEGRLGIALYNASNRYIMIKPGEPIAKIEFSLLPKSVVRPYSGQHGYDTQMWPIATHLCVQPTDASVKSKIGTIEEELALSYGPQIANISKQLRFYRYTVWMQLIIAAIGFAIIFTLYGQLTIVASLIIGVLANLLTTLLVNMIADRLN